VAYVTDMDRMLIGGELVASESGECDETISPATEEVVGRAPRATKGDVERAVAAAEKAWPEWNRRPVDERADVLRAFGDLIAARAEEIARVEAANSGNTITPMRRNVHETVATLKYYAGLAYSLKGETVPSTTRNLHLTVHEPYGVVARIAAFNHPFMFSAARTASALAAGNAVVVKPPETSPLSALILGDIARQALPAGLFNVVTGAGAVGDALVRHPRIKRIALIGSGGTGRAIQRAAAEVAVKHVTLELGGKNPMVVFPDVDLDKAADIAVHGMNFLWQGQSCGSTSRLLLHEDIHDAVLARVVERVAAIKVGDPLRDDSGMGPINSARQYQKVIGFLESSKAEGARLMTGGRRPSGPSFAKGFWVEPTVYADVTQSMRLWREEVFGPILAVSRWRTTEEVIHLANDTEFGLSAAVLTNNINDALHVARSIRAGNIWINGSSTHFLGMPWGGFKNSGVQREEAVEELQSYVETKGINIMLD